MAAARFRGVTDEREARHYSSLCLATISSRVYLEQGSARASGSDAYLRSDGAVLMKRVALYFHCAARLGPPARKASMPYQQPFVVTDDIGAVVGDGVSAVSRTLAWRCAWPDYINYL